MRVGALHCYPLKAARAIDVASIGVEPRGLVGDRRWLLVDRDGRFLTQREMPRLATLTATPLEGGLHLAADGLTIDCPLPSGDERRRSVVWASTVDAASSSTDVDDALSSWAGRPVHLVYQDARASRLADAEWAGPDVPVNFADGYPLLVATQASCDDLNARIVAGDAAPVSMARFRPNIVVDGAEPWAEDAWDRLRIGKIHLDLLKPCTRCTVTTIDQANGVRASEEPLRTLARFRRSKDARVRGVLFGWNAVARSEGTIDVGDDVEVVARRVVWPVG